jgi:hypothetical protein
VDRRLAHNGLFLGIPSLALLIPSFALGAPNDAAAQRLRDQAIDVDYLAANYAAAEKKLNLALSLCEVASNCSPFMRARLHCDLGVVQLMLHKVDLARTEFATALVEDPNVMLDPNLSSTDMQREFAAVKNGSPAPVGAVRAAARIAPAGIVHAPPSGQAVSTPLPLYAEVPRDLAATKVTIRYKPVSGKDWKTISMLPTGAGYGAEIPCADVGNQEGELQYFIQVHDANGDLVATSGRSATPHAVVIVKRLSGEPPHLPGQPPPQACQTGLAAEATGAVTAEASDCPPAFPGCHNEEARYCESRDDCVAGEECIERTCRRGSAHEELAYKKNWVSLGVQAELMFMPGADDACLGDRHYTCFLSSSGAYSPDIPVRGIDDQVIAGFAGAPTFRVLVGYDRAVGPNLTVGGRLGYAFFGGGPQRPAHNGTPAGPSFMPVHLEARLAYFFGRNVLAHVGPRFFVGIAGGMTEIDASESIDMVSKATPTVRTPVDAWTKTGLGFAAVGPGLMYALTPNSGPVLETKAIVLFPTAGVALAAQLGYELGF